VQTVVRELSDSGERTFIEEVISRLGKHPGALLGILKAVQDHNPRNYLSLEALLYVAAKTGIPPAQVFSVATFYAQFNLQPQGDNTVCICRGTACHTRGSRDLLESLRHELGLGEEAELGSATEADKVALTTADHKFTVRTVACFGQCALAPVVEVNHHICGHMNEHTLRRHVRALERENK